MPKPPPPADGPSVPPTPDLVLASRALCEDLAPLEPGATSARRVLAVASAALAALAVARRLGALPDAARALDASTEFGLSAAALALALSPLRYATRALGTAAVGATVLAVGSASAAPLLAALGGRSPGGDLARLAALAALPAALMFRARYRAYPKSRWIVAGALAVALPYAVGRAAVALDGEADPLGRGGALLAVTAVSAGLLGFMDERSTAGGGVWSALLLLIAPLDLFLALVVAGGTGAVAAAGAVALRLGAGATVLGIGAFLLLAARLGGDARRGAEQRAAHPA